MRSARIVSSLVDSVSVVIRDIDVGRQNDNWDIDLFDLLQFLFLRFLYFGSWGLVLVRSICRFC